MKGILTLLEHHQNETNRKLTIKYLILFLKNQFFICKTKLIIYTKKTLTINDSNSDILKSIFTNYYK